MKNSKERRTKWLVIFVAIVAKRLQAHQVVLAALTAHINHTNLSVLMAGKTLLARIVARKRAVQVAALALAVRTKRINSFNLRRLAVNFKGVNLA